MSPFGSAGTPPVGRLLAALACVAACSALVPVLGEGSRERPLSGGPTSARRTGVDPRTLDPPLALVAAFRRPSYAAGDLAVLEMRTRRRPVSLVVLRAGYERGRTSRDDLLLGASARPSRRLRAYGRRVEFSVPDWPSGLYVARLSAPGGWLGFAPFVVRPRRLGEHRVAVVLPTNTWQAYNFRDDDRDGVGDTWYADGNVESIDPRRPYMNRGVPPHFRGYDVGFLRWLARGARDVDMLTDLDLELVSDGARLAACYDLIVFPGHEEYVTRHVYDTVRRFRDLGGNLAFLSANNFFYRVERRGNRLFKLGRWRDQGRPEAPLIGARYVGWFENRYRSAPYTVSGERLAPWLFRGTGLHDRDRFGNYGIEIDARAVDSPPGTLVLARSRDLFGPGRSAEMTYYETRAGAKVFAAGALDFGGSTQWPTAGRLLDNLWRRLSRP